MPGKHGSNPVFRAKFYRGVYGFNARLRIEQTCRRKGRRAVFPDMAGR